MILGEIGWADLGVSTLDKSRLTEKVSSLPYSTMQELDYDIKLIFNIT